MNIVTIASKDPILKEVLKELRELKQRLPEDESLLSLIDKLKNYMRGGKGFKVPEKPLVPSPYEGLEECEPGELLKDYKFSDWNEALDKRKEMMLCDEEMFSVILALVIWELRTKANHTIMDAYKAVMLSSPAELREKLLKYNCKAPWFFFSSTVPMYLFHSGKDMYRAVRATAFASSTITLFRWGNLVSVTDLNEDSKLKGIPLVVYKI